MKEAFSEPLNSLDEYWAGYFRADGTIYKEYSSGFSQKDEDVVYALAKYISHKGKIHNIRCKTTFGDQEITRFSSTAITKNLIKLGVKTNLKEDLYLSKHFWRGMVDGDGSVMINGRGQPVLSLCGWLRDIEEFSKYIENLLNIPGPKSISIKNQYGILELEGQKQND